MRTILPAILIAVTALSAVPVLSADLLVPASAPVAEREKKNRDYFSDLRVTTHDGKLVKFYSDLLKDRIVLIHFFYTTCTAHAPMQAKVLTELQEKLGGLLGKEVFIVSLTVDPERDTQEKIRAYAEKLAPRTGWTFVSGSKPNIDWINFRLGNYRENPAEHSALYLVGDVAAARWVKVAPEGSAELLAGHLRKMVEERNSGAGK